MAAERPRFLLSPDCVNRDPFRGLPFDFPPGHSRFDIAPLSRYGDLSFDPAMVQNIAPDERKTEMGPEQCRAWRDAVRRAVGNLVVIPVDDEQVG